jgi:hypothetical protein
VNCVLVCIDWNDDEEEIVLLHEQLEHVALLEMIRAWL